MSAYVLDFANHVCQQWKERFLVEGRRENDITKGMTSLFDDTIERGSEAIYNQYFII